MEKYGHVTRRDKPDDRSFYSFWASFLFHSSVLKKILNWLTVEFGSQPASLSISYWGVLRILIIFFMVWVFGGIGFYLLVNLIYPVAPQSILFLTGALAVSGSFVVTCDLCSERVGDKGR